MSRVQFEDYFENPEGFDVCDPFRQLTEDLDDMEIPDNLHLENPGLMSSEFFDSVLSLEEQTTNFDDGLNFDNRSSSNVDSDVAFSSDPEELRLNYNCSPDSASSSFSFEINDLVSTNNNNNIECEENNSKLFVKTPQQNTAKLIGPTIQVPGKIILNNPNGKKVIVTKPYAKNNRRNMTNAKHIYKVQSISGNGRSVFLPFNVTKMKNIKIINGTELCAENVQVTKSENAPSMKYEDNYSISSPDTVDEDSDSVDTKYSRQYPVLVLTEEEKRLLAKEGIRLPTHYPLTKNEEKELKRIRRKIRNKISAQDSRKRKKEYVDGLEERLKQSADEKRALINRVKVLQQQNNKLISQMQRLQSLVFNTNKVTPTTCFLIVLMSAFLVSLPNISISKGAGVKNEQQIIARRTLLSSQIATNEDGGSLDEFLLFNRQKPKITTTLDEDVIEEHNAPAYFHYDDECEIAPKKSILEPVDFAKDMRNTLDKMKEFFKRRFNFGSREKGGVSELEVSKTFPKRARYCPELYENYIPTKIPKLDNYDIEKYMDGELNSASDAPSSISLQLAKHE